MTRTSSAKLAAFYRELSPSMDTIRAMLSASGVDLDRPRAADLYERDLDCHNLGMHDVLERIIAVVEEYGPPNSGDVIFDVGCGLGGPGRRLVDRFGCSVVGVDILPLRVELAQALTALTGMQQRATYRVGDATMLSDPDGSFSQAWMLDVGIHVRDKRALFHELARVLQRDGMLVMHEQTGPLPEAMDEARRLAPYHAPTLPRLLELVEEAGLRVVTWRDTTAYVLDYFRGIQALLASAQDADRADDAGDDGVGVRVLHGYVDTFDTGGGRTGMLLARRV